MATTIHECRVIAAEAAKAGVVTQLGNQGRSSVEGRMMVELLRSGAVGKIKEIIFWENKALSWWPKNTDLRPVADPIPGTLAWDLWTGVREPHTYLADTYHPQTWRAWRDFGCGELGDMGCHHFDSSVDGLKLTPPKRVRQTFTGGLKPGMWADAREVEFEFAGNELTASDTLKLTWLDGLHGPKEGSIPLPAAVKKWPASGGVWIGEHGSIFKPYGLRPYLMPEGKYPTGFGKQDHYHDWVDAILAGGGKQSCDPFSHGANLTEIVLCGTLAEFGKGDWVNWNRETQTTGNPAIDAQLKREYRDAWKVPALG
jgi:predicted dehydrogenase